MSEPDPVNEAILTGRRSVVMSPRLILLFSVLCSPTLAADEATDDESEALYQNASILRDTFEMPLQIELLNSGLTPRNAEIAARNMLGSLIECWNSDRNKMAVAEREVVSVRLGGHTIATYKTPCMDEFLADVEKIAR